MREFFKPWRRKVGCATLALACTFTAIWIRTIRHGDEIIVTVLGRAHSIGWEREKLSWWAWRLREPFTLAVHWGSWSRFSDADWPYRQDIEIQRDIDFEEERWRRRSRKSNAIESFDFHRVYSPKTTIYIGHVAENHALAVWEVPCWSVVLPLTLASTYLLLSKLRVAKKIGSSVTTEPGHA